jgi:hypothetical protein
VVTTTHPKRPAVLAVIAALIGVAASLVVAPPAHATGIVTISGRLVTAAATPVGAGDVEVFYQSLIGDGAWSDEASGGVTAADGTFAIPDLDLGTYRLRLDYRGSGDYLDGWYRRDGQVVVAAIADATAFWDRGFSWTTGDIRLLRPTAQQGRVTLPSGDPASARVTAARLDPATGEWMTAGSGTTNGSGDYTIPGLLNDYYRLSVEYLGAGYFTQSSTVVGVLPGTRNFALVATKFNVSGRITGLSASGSVVPLEGFGVFAHDPGSNATWGTVRTDADGRYTIALPAGSYLVHASDPLPVDSDDYVGTWYGGAPQQADAAPVVVGGADVAGVDILLPAGASISGTVDVAERYAGATTLRVSLWDQNPPVGSPIHDTVWVAPGDSYAFVGLPAGTYRVQVFIQEGLTGTVEEWWRGSDGEGDSEVIVVTRGQQATGYDVVVGAAYDAGREIDDRYAELGGASGALGAPTGPYTGSGERMFRAFAGGTIYASRDQGTWVVPAGPVLNAYLAAGGPTSTFGWPTAAQDCAGGVCTQEFEGGTLPRTKPVNTVVPTVSSGSTAVGAVSTVDRGTWKGGPTPTIVQAWLRCNAPVTTNVAAVPAGCVATGARGTTYVSTSYDAGKYITAQVAGINSVGTTNVVALTTVATTGPTIPAATVKPTVSGNAAVGSTWTLNTGTWSGSPTKIVQAWLRCTAPVATNVVAVPAGCVATGARGTTYVSTSYDAGKYITAQVAAINAAGTTNVVALTTVATTGPTVPAATVKPTVSGSAAVGSTWTLNTGTWSGSPTKIVQAWLRCTAPVTTNVVAVPPGCVATGARGTTYVSTSYDAGKYITAQVAAINAAGTTNIVALTTVATTGPMAPAATVAPTVTGNAAIGSTWTLNTGTWSGSPTKIIQAWLRCTAPVTTNVVAVPAGCVATGAKGTTYVSTSSDAGKYITAQVAAYNAVGVTNIVALTTVTTQ